jgi:RNA polymerase sigma-70 factor (ECF subfamily)
MPLATQADRAQAFDALAELAQAAKPALTSEGKTAKVEVFPEIVAIFLEALKREGLIEDSLLAARYRLCGPENQLAREEITQRTFAAIPDALRTFRRDSSIKSYVLGIVGNQYQNWVRETAKDKNIADLPDDDRLAGAAIRSSLLLNRMEIGEVLNDLAPKHRQMILLAFFDGLSAAEIKANLGLSDGQYRNRRRQALKETAELLEERGHGR